jgi:SAM-dependent methyltransferase
MDFTGERYVPGVKGDIELEHLHRYLLARELCHGKDVLDLASGEGYGSAMLSSVAKCVVGVDIAHDAVQHSQRRYVRQNLRFMVGSCGKIPLSDASVDVIVSFETLEHHDRHDEMMAEVKRVLRSDGLLIISTPDKYHYSDVPGYKNEFHVKELYHHEFVGLLRRHFTNASFYGQRVVFGSFVVGKGSNVELAKIREEGAALAWDDEMIDPTYWIGLASDAVLPTFGSGFLEQAIENSETVLGYTQALKASSEEKARLETRLSAAMGEREVEISRLTAEQARLNLALDEKVRQAAELTAQCAAERREKAELGMALAVARSEMAGLDAALAVARSEMAQLDTALATARSVNVELDTTLAAAHQEWADRQAALDEKAVEFAAARIRADRAEAAAAHKELDAVRSGTSWRITRPFREIAARWRVAWDIARMMKRVPWTMLSGTCLREYLVLLARVRLIAPSGLFDSDWYLERNDDVRAAGINPLVHYLLHGAAEGRDPNPLFDTDWYLNRYPDVRAAGANPLVHYLRYGAAEGRDPNPFFDTDWYLDHNPDVRAAGINPLAHYLRGGTAEGRNPGP